MPDIFVFYFRKCWSLKSAKMSRRRLLVNYNDFTNLTRFINMPQRLWILNADFTWGWKKLAVLIQHKGAYSEGKIQNAGVNGHWNHHEEFYINIYETLFSLKIHTGLKRSRHLQTKNFMYKKKYPKATEGYKIYSDFRWFLQLFSMPRLVLTLFRENANTYAFTSSINTVCFEKRNYKHCPKPLEKNFLQTASPTLMYLHFCLTENCC